MSECLFRKKFSLLVVTLFCLCLMPLQSAQARYPVFATFKVELPVVTAAQVTKVSSSNSTRKIVQYRNKYKPGTIIVDNSARTLHFILDRNRAVRYRVAVGKRGTQWTGVSRVRRKAAWSNWYPTANMRRKDPSLPKVVKGGRNNPLGARTIYLHGLYRIHGTNKPWSIGSAASSGCFRLVNDDVIDLYKRVKIGAKVIVKW